jgi:hypothetical protein
VIKYVELRLPSSQGEYPVDWGPHPFPEARGKFSTRLQEWLKEDAPDTWPDVDAEDSGDACVNATTT